MMIPKVEIGTRVNGSDIEDLLSWTRHGLQWSGVTRPSLAAFLPIALPLPLFYRIVLKHPHIRSHLCLSVSVSLSLSLSLK
jgi:hypothetical protein